MKNYFKEAAIVAVGLLLLGVCICYGLTTALGSKRIVSVRGLAEREVVANKVTWPLTFSEPGNDLVSLYQTCNEKNAVIVKFLKDNGIDESDITVQPADLTDQSASQYTYQNEYRYILSSCVVVSSKDVEKVRKLILRQSELLSKGIAIKGNDYENRIDYEYTDLNSIKPEMIEEATKNARAAADKFAQDSDSKLGKIKNAQQGQFSIDDRDSNTPHIKNVRVVTYVDYYLE